MRNKVIGASFGKARKYVSKRFERRQRVSRSGICTGVRMWGAHVRFGLSECRNQESKRRPLPDLFVGLSPPAAPPGYRLGTSSVTRISYSARLPLLHPYARASWQLVNCNKRDGELLRSGQLELLCGDGLLGHPLPRRARPRRPRHHWYRRPRHSYRRPRPRHWQRRTCH